MRDAAGQPVTVDRAGRIVLPVDVRRRLKLGLGSRLTLDVVAQRIELTPQPAADSELQGCRASALFCGPPERLSTLPPRRVPSVRRRRCAAMSGDRE